MRTGIAGACARFARAAGGRPLQPPQRACKRFERLPDGGVSFDVELRGKARLISEANRSRHEHWTTTAERVKAQRGPVGFVVGWTAPRNVRAFEITITRLIGPRGRALDSDNLVRACKAIRDGVSDGLGIDDASERLVFRYREERSPFHGARVELRPRVEAGVCFSGHARCVTTNPRGSA